MKKRFRDLSIKYKLVLLIALTSGISLAFASTAFVTYDVAAFKESMVTDLQAHADIIARNSTAALTFDDYEAATNTLAAFDAHEHVISAYVLRPDGEVFARYQNARSPFPSKAPLLQSEGYRFFPDRLAVRLPIELDGERIGAIYIETDLRELDARVQTYIGTVTTIVACAMIVVLLLSSQFQRVITKPILELASTAKLISRNKNYGVRAKKQANDEVGTLIDGFNEMLSQIQDQDARLERHRSQLEHEVALRTQELRDVNERLRAIVEGTSSTTGAEFFDALVMSLSRALGTRWVMVGALDESLGRVRAVALYDGEKVRRGFTFELAGTAAVAAIHDEFCIYDDDVASVFPTDALVKEWGVRSYVGLVLRDSSGKPIGLLTAFHDDAIPGPAKDESLLRVFASRTAVELERVIVETELFKSESRTRAILDSAADGIITVNEDGRVETFNAAAEQIFKRQAADVIGKDLSLLVREPGVKEGEAAGAPAAISVLSRFIGKRGELEGVRTDGGRFPMNIAVSEMNVGDEIAYTAIVRDITRERELERMKSDFVSTVSHEIRTPLSCIISSAKILLRSGEAKPGVTEKFSSIIVDEGKRLTRLINDLLDLAKMDAKKVDWAVKEVDPAELVHRVIALTQTELRAVKLQFKTRVEPDVPPVFVDPDKILQVLTNLVSNAVKFTPAGGTIEISAERSDPTFVRIAVSDTGVGIAAEHRDVIFERFKQIGDVLTDRPQGTGLGLPICKEIVEHFGGVIEVESNVGKGSTFWFTVPVAGAFKRVTPRRDDRRVVLVVDDDAATLEVLAYHFENSGFRVVRASRGDEALALARQHRPNLVTLDIMMPDISGYDVLRSLRRDPELADTPVLLLSVLAEESQSERALKLGANAYLSKPVDGDTLLGKVNELLGGERRQVLVINDDLRESGAIKAELEARGYAVYQAFDEDSGLRLAGGIDPGLIILGTSTSRLQGDRILQELRRHVATRDVPVVLLTSRDLDDAKAFYFETAMSKIPDSCASVADTLSVVVQHFAGDADEIPVATVVARDEQA